MFRLFFAISTPYLPPFPITQLSKGVERKELHHMPQPSIIFEPRWSRHLSDIIAKQGLHRVPSTNYELELSCDLLQNIGIIVLRDDVRVWIEDNCQPITRYIPAARIRHVPGRFIMSFHRHDDMMAFAITFNQTTQH